MLYKIPSIDKQEKFIKILIIKISSAGDIIHSTAVITGLYKYLLEVKKEKELENKVFNFQIDNVIDPQYLKLVENLDIYKNFYFYDELKYKKLLNEIKVKPYLLLKNIITIIKEIFHEIKKINKINYDYIFDLQGIEKSLIFYLFCKGKYKACKWSLPYKYLKENKSLHAVDAMAFVIKKYFPHFNPYKITIKIEEEKILNKIKNENKNFILDIIKENNYLVFSPFTRWESKNLPLIYYLLLSYFIKEHFNKKIIFIGSKKEREIFNDFLKNLILNKEKFLKNYYKSNFLLENVKVFLEKYLNYDLNLFLENIQKDVENNKLLIDINSNILNKYIYILIGILSLDEVPLIIKNSKLFIGSDSMNLFIADSQFKNNLAFFGPTYPERVAPYNTKNTNKSFVYQNSQLKCIKCYKRKCPKKNDDFMKCLYNINFKLIIETIEYFLNNN